jgi:hypothetical protein
LFRFVVAERMGTIILSAFVAHTGWHWTLERGAALGQFQGPSWDASFVAALLRWAVVGMMVGGVVWVVVRLLRGPAEVHGERPTLFQRLSR